MVIWRCKRSILLQADDFKKKLNHAVCCCVTPGLYSSSMNDPR